MDSDNRRSGDHVFPVASDPDRMRPVFERHLRAVDGRPVTVVGCEVEFARRGDPRSLFQYRVRLRDPDGGADRDQAITAVAYGSRRTARTWERIQSRLPAPPPGPLALVPAAYVPDLDLLLQVFPFDHQLPALAPLMAGPWPPLAEPLLAGFGPGAWRIDDWRSELVRYRVDLRATLRLRLRASDSAAGVAEERCFYVKVYGNRKLAERALAVQRDLDAALSAGDGSLATAPTIAWLEDELVTVHGEVAATSLRDIPASAENRAEAVRRTARAIAALHQLKIDAPVQKHDLDRTGPERLGRSAARLRAARPDLADDVDAVEAAIMAGFAACGELDGVPVHGDLKTAHVLLGEGTVTLLDFDKFAAGEPMLDVVSVARSLLPGQTTLFEVGAGAPAAAFVAEYFANVPAEWSKRLAPYYAASLVAEAASVGRTVRGSADGDRRAGKRANRARTMLDEARRVLADGAAGSGPPEIGSPRRPARPGANDRRKR